jgi:hypothetical protein
MAMRSWYGFQVGFPVSSFRGSDAARGRFVVWSIGITLTPAATYSLASPSKLIY